MNENSWLGYNKHFPKWALSLSCMTSALVVRNTGHLISIFNKKFIKQNTKLHCLMRITIGCIMPLDIDARASTDTTLEVYNQITGRKGMRYQHIYFTNTENDISDNQDLLKWL